MSKQEAFLRPEIEEKIDALLAQMTLAEKIGQLNQVGPSPVGGFEIPIRELEAMLQAGRITKEEFDRETSGKCWDAQEDEVRAGRIGSFLGIRGAESCNHMQRIAVEESRLGIPLLFGLDVIHGYRTIFPIPLAEACSWDETLYEKSAAIAAAEAIACGINWTFAPMVDIARDARWGRIAEGAGEEPYITSRFAAAKVRGFQGKDMSAPDKIAACAKHFAAYGAAIGGRDYNTADLSMQTLWETYLPPFKAAADAGVATFMGAFNDINGVPCTTNPYLYKEVLRGKWGFNGMVVSDASAIRECIAHGTCADMKDAACQAINAGMDMDMGSFCYIAEIEALVNEGKVSMETLDETVRHILRLKFNLGLFDNPYVDPERCRSLLLCEEHRAAARDAAHRSAVLLKNSGVLPLRKNAKIAVVGALAAAKGDMLGTWACMGRPEEAVSLVDGLAARGVDFTYAECCTVGGVLNQKELANAVVGADLVIACVGETRDMNGEASSLRDIGLHGQQNEMLASIKELGLPLVTLVFGGRPMALAEAAALSDAMLEAWSLGSEAGNALGDILFGDYNPSGRLTTTFPHHTGECPVYYDHTPTGRPTSEIRHTCKYLDGELAPLFPFGHGLSYTQYEYTNLAAVMEGDTIRVTVDVQNTGSVAGEETVQVYVHDKVASRERPVRQLKGFAKLWLAPGEKQTAMVDIKTADLGFYDFACNYVVEPGEFEIFAGHDSTAALTVTVAV